jgi:hypothetical protein
VQDANLHVIHRKIKSLAGEDNSPERIHEFLITDKISPKVY